jgi:hypothetical protein
MERIEDSNNQNSFETYIAFGAAVLSIACGVFAYIKCKFQKTPLINRTEQRANKVLNGIGKDSSASKSFFSASSEETLISAKAQDLLAKTTDERFKGNLMNLLEGYRGSKERYIDSFKKEADFNKVLTNLKQKMCVDLMLDETFNQAFSRILRYILLHTNPADVKTCFGGKINVDAHLMFEMIFGANENIGDPPKLLQRPQTVAEFIDSSDHKTRISAISNYFSLRKIIPVRGDGNCFLNALSAGILEKLRKDPSYKDKLIGALLPYEYSDKPYVIQDQNSTHDFEKGFYKASDYQKVIESLNRSKISDLFEDQYFNGSFTRILRYALTHAFDEDKISPECGSYVDAEVIRGAKNLFDLKCRVAVIDAGSGVEKIIRENFNKRQNYPEGFLLYEAQGEQRIVDTKTTRKEKDTLDFVLLRNGAHFVCAYA